MSFFVRLADRGGFAPRNQAAPVLTPKGGPVRRMPAATPDEEETALPLRRQETGEEEELRTLRRAQEEEMEPLRRQEDEDETAAPLRRQEDQEEEAQALRRQEEEEEVQPVRRQPGGQDEEELRSLRRQEEEEEAQPLRRQTMGEEEELRNLRRQEDEAAGEARPLRRQEDEQKNEEAQLLRRQGEDEEIEPARISRAGRPSEPGLDPDEAHEPEPPLDVPEPSDLSALRRDVAGGQAHAPLPRPEAGMPAGSDPGDGATEATGHAAEPFVPPSFPAPAAPPTRSGGGDRFERPHVVIDQVDVLVHEPAAPATARPPATGRRIRARYLRRL